MAEETTTLRDAARRLARAKNPKAKGIQSAELFSVLRAGNLRAGFFILEGSVWVEIPISHWESLAREKFAGIGRKPNDPKSGSYRIRGNQFSDQIAKIISDQIQVDRHDPKTALATISAVIAAAEKMTEVTIKTRDITNYLQTLGLNEQFSTGKAGRHRKEGWREICSYMAAYMTAHFRDQPSKALKIKEAGRQFMPSLKRTALRTCLMERRLTNKFLKR